MSDEVVLWVDYKVKPGKLKAFRDVVADMFTISEQEPGFLTQELYALGDGYNGYINERYSTSEDLVEHVTTWQTAFGIKFFECAEVVRLVAMGKISPAAKAILGNYGTVTADYIQGFSK